MTSTQYILLVALFLGFGLLEYILGRAQKFNANAGDNAQDMIGFVLWQPSRNHLYSKQLHFWVTNLYRNTKACMPICRGGAWCCAFWFLTTCCNTGGTGSHTYLHCGLCIGRTIQLNT